MTDRGRTPTRTFAAGLCAVCAVALLIRWPIADIPFERDEGEYAYIARHWLRGEVPYRDAFDQKPPGVFVAYAVIETLIGSGPAAIHWGTQLYTLGTLVLVALIGRRFLNERAGLLAALLTAYMTADVCVLGNAANTEVFMILPLAGGFLCAVYAIDGGRASWAAAAGALSCLAMQFKQVALPNAVYHGLLLLALGRPRLPLCAAYVGGGLVAAVPTVAYFWSVGAWHEFYDCVVGHNLAYAQRVPLADYPDWFWYHFHFILSKWWPIFAIGVVGLVDRGGDGAAGRRTRLVLSSWLLFSFLGVCTGGYFREHYFFQIVPAVAVLAGRGLTVLAEKLAPGRGGLLAWSAAGLAIAGGALVAPWYFIPGHAIKKVDAIYRGCPFGESLAVADYVARNTGPHDTVFIYGSEPQILCYADRTSASRYIFVYPLMTPFPDTVDRQAAAFEEVKRARPRVILVVNSGGSFCADEGTPSLLGDALGTLLRSEYRLVGTADTGDTDLLPFTGGLTAENPAQPKIDHTLAVWERVGS
ncbi:MAG TPA: glycosyltransferase family 39 protein [Gemmataceae bacterium]|jgi:4-amino-4-deoxy-L-arabinose transferase-like glycosyltransferase